MEQRTLLAIILSLMVLLIYSAASTRLPHKVKPEILSQNIENKDLMKKESVLTEPKESVKEKISVLKSETLHAEFSNIGGTLIKANIKKFNYSLPITDILTIKGFEKSVFHLEELSAERIIYTFENDDFKISKIYQFFKNYLLLANIKIENKTKMSKNGTFEVNNFTVDMSRLDNNETNITEKSLLEYSISTPNGVFRKNNAFKFSSQDKKHEESSANWIGFRNRYFCTIIKPEYNIQSYSVNPVSENSLEVNFLTKDMVLEENTAYDLKSLIFVGPQDLSLLKSYKLNLEGIINFSPGGFGDVMALGMTDIIAKTILGLIIFFHKLFQSWGVAIVILGFFIYLFTYPLTLKSMASMKKMQSLQPEIAKIKEKNKNSVEKLNKEIMELYKKNKFNPLGGCLPSLLQVPIFISLYQVLWRSVNFKGANFLWISDLSLPDRLFVLPYSIPLLGQEINILPILLMIIMFFQQKISLKNKVSTDKNSEDQQKIMLIALPLMIGFFFYKTPSGLALYFLTFYFLSTFTQLKMSRTLIKVET